MCDPCRTSEFTEITLEIEFEWDNETNNFLSVRYECNQLRNFSCGQTFVAWLLASHGSLWQRLYFNMF